MSGKQILNKLILSTAFSTGITADKENNPENRRTLITMNPNRDIYTVWKKGDLPGSGANTFRHFVTEAYKAIQKAQTSGAFILFDGRGASEPEIINFITARAEKGAVVLLDYIQKMPPKPGTDTDSFRRVQAISYDVVTAAAKTNAVIIAGAQFNRLGGTDGLGDVFDDQSFREAGDIEQDAHNAIGIGWKTDKQGRFYEVLKTREDKKQGTLYDIDFVGEYSYMTQADQTFRKSKGKSNTGKKKIPTGSRKEPLPLSRATTDLRRAYPYIFDCAAYAKTHNPQKIDTDEFYSRFTMPYHKFLEYCLDDCTEQTQYLKEEIYKLMKGQPAKYIKVSKESTVFGQPVIITFKHTDLKTSKEEYITNIGHDAKVDLVQVQILKDNVINNPFF
jgi:hypothetical protein